MRRLAHGALAVRGRSHSCDLCLRGSKLVLFITGICPRYGECFYCTIGPGRRGRDIVLADEIEVRSDDDVLWEARAIGAEGAGILAWPDGGGVGGPCLLYTSSYSRRSSEGDSISICILAARGRAAGRLNSSPMLAWTSSGYTAGGRRTGG